MPSEVLLGALRRIWTILEPLGVPVALMGGVALSAWNHPRSTRDVDLLIGLDKSGFGSMFQALLTAGLRAKRQPAIMRIDEQEIAQFLYTPDDEFFDVQIDLLLAGTPYQHIALARRIELKFSTLDFPIWVLSCEDMILHKLLAGRLIDSADAAMLLRENRAELDFAYLGQWLTRLKVAADFARIWAEAFPGEQLPGLNAS